MRSLFNPRSGEPLCGVKVKWRNLGKLWRYVGLAIWDTGGPSLRGIMAGMMRASRRRGLTVHWLIKTGAPCSAMWW